VNQVSKELAQTTPVEIEQAVAAIMDGQPLPAIGDPEIVSRAILERILAAETFEEAFRPQQLTGWREYLDQPVQVRDFRLNRSGYENGSPVYAVVDLTVLETGEAVTVTCGGRNVLMQLVRALQKGWLDRPVRLTAKKTAEGFEALWLEDASVPF
jgi:hypothetical protein